MTDTIQTDEPKLPESMTFGQLEKLCKKYAKAEYDWKTAKNARDETPEEAAYKDSIQARKVADLALRSGIVEFQEENPGAKMPPGLGKEMRLQVDYDDERLIYWLITNLPIVAADFLKVDKSGFQRYVENIVDADGNLRWMINMPIASEKKLSATVGADAKRMTGEQLDEELEKIEKTREDAIADAAASSAASELKTGQYVRNLAGEIGLIREIGPCEMLIKHGGAGSDSIKKMLSKYEIAVNIDGETLVWQRAGLVLSDNATYSAAKENAA